MSNKHGRHGQGVTLYKWLIFAVDAVLFVTFLNIRR